MKIFLRLFAILTILVSLFIFYSCANIEEIKIGAIKEVEFKGMNDNILTFQIVAPIDNPNHFRLHVKSSDLVVFLGNTEVGKVKEINNLDIESHCQKDYPVVISVQINDLKSLMGPAMQLMSGKNPDVRLTGKIKVRSFLYQRTISVSNFKLER